jgi:hypothetical protein
MGRDGCELMLAECKAPQHTSRCVNLSAGAATQWSRRRTSHVAPSTSPGTNAAWLQTMWDTRWELADMVYRATAIDREQGSRASDRFEFRKTCSTSKSHNVGCHMRHEESAMRQSSLPWSAMMRQRMRATKKDVQR